MSTYLYRRYTRRRHRGHFKPIGLLIAEINGTDLKIGWSLCHKNDSFNRKTAAAMCTMRIKYNPVTINTKNTMDILAAFDFIPETLHESLVATIEYTNRRHDRITADAATTQEN